MSIFPTRILLATDGSEDAELAARAATDLSTRAGAELHIIHAWQDLRPANLPAMATGEYSRAYEQDEREGRELLDELAERLKNNGGAVKGTHLRRGRPADEIADLAQELGADLVVVGSRGLGSVKRLVVGSVSDGVVNLAACPTLVVRGGEEAWPPSRLIVGDDASDEARRAGRLASSMGKLLEAQAVLVRVYPQVTVFKANRIVHTRASEGILKKGERSLEERAAELGSLLGRRPEVRIASGDAAAIIQEMAEESGRGTLVTVGRRGLDAARYFALGSVSTGILRAASGSVLIVPSA